MSVIFFLIGIGIVVAGGFLAAFIWAVRSGQYEDDYTHSVRMLFDNKKSEEQTTPTDNTNNSKNNKHETKKSNEPFPV